LLIAIADSSVHDSGTRSKNLPYPSRRRADYQSTPMTAGYSRQ